MGFRETGSNEYGYQGIWKCKSSRWRSKAVWLQTMANVLNLSVEKMEGMIGPAFGIALLASYKSQNFSSLQRINKKAM